VPPKKPSTDIREMDLVCVRCFRAFHITMTFGDDPPTLCAACRNSAARAMIGETDTADRTADAA